MKFDDNLRRLRKEKEYSQEYLAAKLDVTRQTISKWENGTAMPDLKKLVELAELFGVTMDALLGISEYSSDKAEAFREEDRKNANDYTNQLIERINESSFFPKYRRLKTALVLVSLLLFVSIAVAFHSVSSINNKLINLENNVQFWLNEMSNIRNDAYNSGSEYYDIDIRIAQYYPETPEKVKAQFRYAPSVYPKNAKIYYLIPNQSGGVDRLEAKENNGEFVLTADVDLSLNKPCYFVLDDGEDIVKQETCLSWNYIYGGFSYMEPEGYYTVSKTAKENSYFFSFENSSVYWDKSIAQNTPSAVYFIIEQNGAEIYNTKIDKSFEDIQDWNFYDEMNFVVNDIELSSEIHIYIKAVCDNAMEHRLSFPYQFRSEAAADAGADKLEIIGEHHYDVLFESDGKEQTIRLW